MSKTKKQPPASLAAAHGSAQHQLWKHLLDEHNLMLLESEIHEIVRLSEAVLDERRKERNYGHRSRMLRTLRSPNTQITET